MALMTVSCLAGVTDSSMSPYFCPLVRSRTDGANTMCGIMISVRFATQIIFVLVFGQLMSRVGAARIFVISVLTCGLFNMCFSSVVLVTDSSAFTFLSFIFLIGSMIGDSGVFCSIYVLAAQTSFSFKPKTENGKDELNASGPAWIETMYGCGSMLGPPVGGLVFMSFGFSGVILTSGACVFTVGCLILLCSLLINKNEATDGENCDKELFDEVKETDKLHCSSSSIHENKLISKTPDEIEDFIGDNDNKSVSSFKEDHNLSYLKILSVPIIVMCCVLQISSGLMSSWFLSSLQNHLSGPMSLTTGQIGLTYMCQSLVYMTLTPLVGSLLDRGWCKLPFVFIGLGSNILGYVLLGPSSFLTSTEPHVAYTVSGLILIGVGQGTCLITCLNIMLTATRVAGHEGNAGKLTSLWEGCEMIGGYLGSTFGGMSADAFGFRDCTNIIVGVEIILLVILVIFLMFQRKNDSKQ